MEKQKDYWVIYNRVNRAIKKGIISKPHKCSICGEYKRIIGHHDNYNEPLKVIWVCQSCHTRIHKNTKAIELSKEGVITLQIKRKQRIKKLNYEEWLLEIKKHFQPIKKGVKKLDKIINQIKE